MKTITPQTHKPDIVNPIPSCTTSSTQESPIPDTIHTLDTIDAAEKLEDKAIVQRSLGKTSTDLCFLLANKNNAKMLEFLKSLTTKECIEPLLLRGILKYSVMNTEFRISLECLRIDPTCADNIIKSENDDMSGISCFNLLIIVTNSKRNNLATKQKKKKFNKEFHLLLDAFLKNMTIVDRLDPKINSTSLSYACSSGMLDVTEKILSFFPKLIESTNANTVQGLFRACENNHIHIVRYLTKINPTLLSQQDSFRMTPLHIVLEKEYTELSKYIIDCIVKNKTDALNIQNINGYTPINFACYCDNFEIADILLKYDVDLRPKNSHGMDVITYCTINNNTLMMAKFLKKIYNIKDTLEEIHEKLISIQNSIDKAITNKTTFQLLSIIKKPENQFFLKPFLPCCLPYGIEQNDLELVQICLEKDPLLAISMLDSKYLKFTGNQVIMMPLQYADFKKKYAIAQYIQSFINHLEATPTQEYTSNPTSQTTTTSVKVRKKLKKKKCPPVEPPATTTTSSTTIQETTPNPPIEKEALDQQFIHTLIDSSPKTEESIQQERIVSTVSTSKSPIDNQPIHIAESTPQSTVTHSSQKKHYNKALSLSRRASHLMQPAFSILKKDKTEKKQTGVLSQLLKSINPFQNIFNLPRKFADIYDALTGSHKSGFVNYREAHKLITYITRTHNHGNFIIKERVKGSHNTLTIFDVKTGKTVGRPCTLVVNHEFLGKDERDGLTALISELERIQVQTAGTTTLSSSSF